MTHLVVHYPDGRTVRFPLSKDEMVVGRDSSCDIPLQDAITSRQHAKLFHDAEGGLWIEDLKSKNGIILNEEQVNRSAPLKDGDTIGIGTCSLKIQGEARPTVVTFEGVTETQLGTASAWNANQRLDLPQQRLRTLYELNERLTGRLDRDDLLSEVLDVVTEQLRFERAGIAIWNGPPHQAEWVHLRNLSDGSSEFRMSRTVVDRALHQAQRTLINDTADGEIDPTASMISNHILSAMCVPMIYLQEVHGVIYGDRVTSTGGYTKEDIDFFAALGRLGAMGLANCQLVDEIKKRQIVEMQFQMAREIQSHLFPATALQQPGLVIEGLNDPGLKVSGDYYDYFERPDGNIALVIADVVGKGVPASLLMANLQAAVQLKMATETDLVRTVRDMNELICRNVSDSRFITAQFCLLEPAARKLSIVNAGHLPPYLIRGGELWEKIEIEASLPIGLDKDFAYTMRTVEIPPEATVVFYTDGIPEAENEEGEQFQDERFESALQANLDQPPGELITRIRRTIKQFTRNHTQTDDITIVALRLD